ncbi:MAG: acyl carrier protein, partial [Sporichthyaceae bacterium]|nr:acyl carrier protein [Sporichthyaceae bacterium]
ANGSTAAGAATRGPSRSEWLEQLTPIVTEVLELKPGQLSRTGDFINDYGADSLRAIDIIARIEQDLDVRIPDEAMPQLTNLDAVVDLVARYSAQADPDA